LDITRKKAASSASQSSDLRQKMKKPTAHQIVATIMKKMVNKREPQLMPRHFCQRSFCIVWMS
jgi:hypothetical protein